MRNTEFDFWFFSFLESFSLEAQNTVCAVCGVIISHTAIRSYTQTAFTEMTTGWTQLMSNACEIPQSQTNLKRNNLYDTLYCKQTNNIVQHSRSTYLDLDLDHLVSSSS